MEPGFYWARLKAIRIGEQPGEWRVEEIKAPREGDVQRISVLHEWGPRIDPPDAPAARPVPELPDGWHVEVLFEGLPQERVTLSDGRDAVAIGDAGCLSISLWAARKFIVIPAGVYRYLLARAEVPRG